MFVSVRKSYFSPSTLWKWFFSILPCENIYPSRILFAFFCPFCIYFTLLSKISSIFLFPPNDTSQPPPPNPRRAYFPVYTPMRYAPFFHESAPSSLSSWFYRTVLMWSQRKDYTYYHGALNCLNFNLKEHATAFFPAIKACASLHWWIY